MLLKRGTKNFLEEKRRERSDKNRINSCCCCQLTDITSGAYTYGGREKGLYYKRAHGKYICKLL